MQDLFHTSPDPVPSFFRLQPALFAWTGRQEVSSIEEKLLCLPLQQICYSQLTLNYSNDKHILNIQI